MSTSLNAFVHTLRYEASDVISVELRPAAGSDFPPFTAGAHIDLHLPNGMQRSYSLCNDSADKGRYVVGVLRDRASRGGSRCVHEQLRVGMPLTISAPHNNFPLHAQAGHSVLIAGGIGVTPILCMARHLSAMGRSFEVMYFARTRAGAAFIAELQALGMPLRLHLDDEAGGPPDLKALLSLRQPDAQTHYYACGPSVMLDAFEKICAELQHTNAHIERFAAVEVAAAADARTTYTVQLHRSAKSITVTPAKSLLDTLLEAGIDVPYSCCEGVCGSCETRVMDGEPDHRDSILSAKERAANNVMMLCVSGCKSPSLTLDL